MSLYHSRSSLRQANDKEGEICSVFRSILYPLLEMTMFKLLHYLGQNSDLNHTGLDMKNTKPPSRMHFPNNTPAHY